MLDYLNAFLQFLELNRNASPHTVRAYESDLSQFLQHIAAQAGIASTALEPAHLDRPAIRSFLSAIHKQGQSRATAARKLAAARTFLRYLRREGAIDGDPGAAPGYAQRLDFMARHYHRLLEQRGERFASLTFRKVANWYCRVLRPGREVQQRLMRLERSADFDAIVAQLRHQGAPPYWQAGALPEIAVPQGPNERW